MPAASVRPPVSVRLPEAVLNVAPVERPERLLWPANCYSAAAGAGNGDRAVSGDGQLAEGEGEARAGGGVGRDCRVGGGADVVAPVRGGPVAQAERPAGECHGAGAEAAAGGHLQEALGHVEPARQGAAAGRQNHRPRAGLGERAGRERQAAGQFQVARGGVERGPGRQAREAGLAGKLDSRAAGAGDGDRMVAGDGQLAQGKRAGRAGGGVGREGAVGGDVDVVGEGGGRTAAPAERSAGERYVAGPEGRRRWPCAAGPGPR